MTATHRDELLTGEDTSEESMQNESRAHCPAPTGRAGVGVGRMWGHTGKAASKVGTQWEWTQDGCGDTMAQLPAAPSPALLFHFLLYMRGKKMGFSEL